MGFDLKINQGATFQLDIIWKVDDTPVDLTGYTAEMQVKENIGSVAVLSLSTSNGKITLGTADGRISLLIPPEDTEGATWRRGLYDLEMNNAGTVTRLLEGRVTLSPEVTT